MKRLLPLCVALLLVGCGANTDNNAEEGGVDQVQINAQVQTQLEQAATSVQGSLQTLAAIEKLQAQNNVAVPLLNVTDPALNQMISIKWYGPVEPLLSQIAKATGYTFQMFGTPPSLPILVNIDTSGDPASAINIIRNADLQSGLKGAILIFQNEKVISLRYTPS